MIKTFLVGKINSVKSAFKGHTFPFSAFNTFKAFPLLFFNFLRYINIYTMPERSSHWSVKKLRWFLTLMIKHQFSYSFSQLSLILPCICINLITCNYLAHTNLHIYFRFTEFWELKIHRTLFYRYGNMLIALSDFLRLYSYIQI